MGVNSHHYIPFMAYCLQKKIWFFTNLTFSNHPVLKRNMKIGGNT
jgi:hypothetical protein